MRFIFFIGTGAALAMLAVSGGISAQPAATGIDARVARYCTSCATVQSFRIVDRRYELVVRYANGKTDTLRYDNDPGFRQGDKVRVTAGVLTRDE